MSKNSKHTRLEDAEAEIERLREELKTLEAVKWHDSMRDEPVAIVGMGCRFPGGVDTPEAFWELLASGKDILGGIPESRWDVDAFYDAEVSVLARCMCAMATIWTRSISLTLSFLG